MVNCPGYDEQQSLGEGGGVGTPDTHTVTCELFLADIYGSSKPAS